MAEKLVKLNIHLTSGKRCIMSGFGIQLYTTIDRRNGRDCTKIRKAEYLKRFKNLLNKEVIKEETNKRGVKLFTATRKGMTCTIKLQVKVA